MGLFYYKSPADIVDVFSVVDGARVRRECPWWTTGLRFCTI
ncbi:hypothetical protein [Thalassoglobus sp.]